MFTQEIEEFSLAGRVGPLCGKESAHYLAGYGDLGQMEDSVAAMAHQARPGLDQVFAQGGQRPALDPFARRPSPQELGQIVGPRVKLVQVSRWGRNNAICGKISSAAAIKSRTIT